jgi:hypothetical protein
LYTRARVLAPLPSVDACSALSAPSETERTREDELLAAFERVRLEGGVVCGSEPPTTPGLPLRFASLRFERASLWVLTVAAE